MFPAKLQICCDMRNKIALKMQHFFVYAVNYKVDWALFAAFS